jgi:hypothetical protein
MEVKWFAELLRVRTATGAAAEAPPAKDPVPPAAGGGGAKEDPAPARKAEALGTLRGLEIPAGVDRPVLVYFHWPHEDGDRGKRVLKFCGGPLDDEAFVLLAPQFHCVEVNTKDSDAKLVEEAKVASVPAILVCRPDGAILWRTEDAGLSGKSLAAALRRVLQDSFPERWAAIEEEVKSQKADLAEAKRALAAKKDAEAIPLLNGIVGSEVRFGAEWSEARKLLREAERRVADREAREAEGR